MNVWFAIGPRLVVLHFGFAESVKPELKIARHYKKERQQSNRLIWIWTEMLKVGRFHCFLHAHTLQSWMRTSLINSYSHYSNNRADVEFIRPDLNTLGSADFEFWDICRESIALYWKDFVYSAENENDFS